MVKHSLPAMSVLFLSADHAMNMKERMGISLVRNAKPDTKGTKVC